MVRPVSGHGFALAYNPMIVAIDQRTWTDVNRDDIAQENEMGPSSVQNLGLRPNVNPDPEISRPYQLVTDVGVQHQLTAGLAISVSYNRRDFHKITWRQNLALDIPRDYTLINIPDPRDGSQTLPVYNLAPGKLGLIDELDATSSENKTWYQGVDVTVNMRWRNATLYGGTSTGRTLSAICQVEDPNSLRFCDNSQYHVPFQTLFKLAGTFPLPRGFRLSANFQSLPGAERTVNYSVVRSILPTLTQTSVNVRLNTPGSLYYPTVNQLDITASKSFRFGGVDVRPELALFNAFNANQVLTAQQHLRPVAEQRDHDLESTSGAPGLDSEVSNCGLDAPPGTLEKGPRTQSPIATRCRPRGPFCGLPAGC